MYLENPRNNGKTLSNNKKELSEVAEYKVNIKKQKIASLQIQK